MDYTLSPNNVVDAGTGFRRHEDNQALPTVVSEKDMNSLIWAAMEVTKAAGVAAVAFDETIPASYTDVARAIRRLAGANITVVTFAMSPFVLTSDHAGLVQVDCTGGNVVINKPLANVVAALPLEYSFELTVNTANTLTVNRAGANLIDGVASFVMSGQFASRTTCSNGVDAWFTLSAPTPVASTAEAQAQTDNTKIITALRLAQAFQGANQSIVANGYQRMPGGLLFQWGLAIGTPGGSAVSFPLTFPTACRAAICGSGSTSNAPSAGAVTTTGFTLFTSSSSSSHWFFAIGS